MSQANLETSIAHLSAQLDDLSDVVARQDREILQLTRQVQMLLQREAHREADSSGGVVLGDERPPHW